MQNLWLHHLVLLIHVCAGLFWLGWMVLIFFLLTPVLRERVPNRVRDILSAVKNRIRRVVFWLIVVIVLTGLYNIYVNGLYEPGRLFYTNYGHRFLIKLGAALLLFSVYGLAPYITGADSNAEGCGGIQPSRAKITAVLHVIAFSAGIVAAFLGMTL